MQKCILFLTLWIFLSGCYERPKTYTSLAGSEAKLNCQTVAVAVIKKDVQYPLWEFSGWSRGIPRVSNWRAEIYSYDPATTIVKRTMLIKPPRGLEREFNIHVGWWDHDGLYVSYEGCAANDTKSNCHVRRVSRKILDIGKIVTVQEIPQPTKEVSDGYRICTAYIQGNKVTVGPTGGPWKEILYLDDNKGLVVSGKLGGKI